MKKKMINMMLAAVSVSAIASMNCMNVAAEEKTTTITYLNHTGEEKTIAYEDSLIEEFMQENPNIKIEVQRMSMDDYTQTIQTKIASGDAPDVFMIELSNLEKYAKNEFLLDISDTAIAEHYDGNMLSYEGKAYGAPLGVNSYVVTYNKVIFEEVGVEIPTTLTEFYEVCEDISEAGYIPFAAGYQDSWVLMADLQGEYAASIMKDDLDALKKLENRETTFSESEDWRGVFERFGKRLSYTQNDQFGTDWNTACTMLANNEAAMIISGDWTSNNISDMGESVELGAFPIPVSEAEEENVIVYPGAGQSYAISADSEKQDAAVKFVEFMTTPEAGAKYVEDEIGICVIKDVEVGEAEGSLADITALMNEGKAVALSAEADFNFTEEYRDAFQNVVSTFALNGGEDVDEVLAELDAEFDRIAED